MEKTITRGIYGRKKALVEKANRSEKRSFTLPKILKKIN
jgi:hypothetical protein